MSAFPYIRAEGSAEKRGRQYGATAAQLIRRGLDIYRPSFTSAGLDWAEVRTRAGRFAGDIASSDPELFREIEGIAAGAGLPVEDIIVINARTELLYGGGVGAAASEGCTGAVALGAAAGGSVLHGQTWDWRAECLHSTIVLHVVPDEGPEIITLVEAGGLARAGINSAGIAITGNFLRCEQDSGAGGTPLPIVRRRMLEREHFAEALGVVIDARTCFSNNIIVSTAEGDAINFEKTPEECFWITPEAGLLVHANHFVSAAARTKVRDLGLTVSPDSLYRDRRVAEVLRAASPGVTMETMRTAFADRFGTPHSVCRPPTAGGIGGSTVSTVATVIMDVSAGTFNVCAAPYDGQEFATYRFDKWCRRAA